MKHPFIKLNRINVFRMFQGIDWNSIGKQLESWKEGQEGYIEIKKKAKLKSQEQLGYYYAVILPEAIKAFEINGDFSLMITSGKHRISLELTQDNMDSFLKNRYAAKIGIHVDKSEMNMAECSAYEDWCIMWLAQWLGCHIPPSDANWRDKI